MTGQTIATVRATQPEISLWDFLAQLPSTMEAQVFVALMMSGAAGICAHYLHKWIKDEITGNLFDYLFHQYPKRTAASCAAYLAWMLSLVGSGVFTTPSGEFVGWGIVLILGLTNGYGVDSLANKGGRAVWPQYKREDKRDELSADAAVAAADAAKEKT